MKEKEPASGNKSNFLHSLFQTKKVLLIVILALGITLAGLSLANKAFFKSGKHVVASEMMPVQRVDPDFPKMLLANEPVYGEFMVKLYPKQDQKAVIADLAKKYNVKVTHEYSTEMAAFAVKASPEDIRKLSNDKRVSYAEENGIARVASVGSWGLDRIDQRELPMDGNYTPDNGGNGVNIYIIDTGIRPTHNEFGGRADIAFDVFKDGLKGADCHFHGTHVAGTAAGSTYGVAKSAKIHGVKVLDCTGSGTWEQVIEGIDWVAKNHQSPAVVNMSIGGQYSSSVNDAVARLTASGVTSVIAAGNSQADACEASPASAPSAITVGATTQTDAVASFSNHGPCLDIFAPGFQITSSTIASDTSTGTFSGTSMAAPHVTGIVALYLQNHPGASPAEVQAAVVDVATNKLLIPGSATKFAYSNFSNPGPNPPAPTLAPVDPSKPPVISTTVDGQTITNYTPFVMNWDAPGGTHYYDKIEFVCKYTPESDEKVANFMQVALHTSGSINFKNGSFNAFGDCYFRYKQQDGQYLAKSGVIHIIQISNPNPPTNPTPLPTIDTRIKISISPDVTEVSGGTEITGTWDADQFVLTHTMDEFGLAFGNSSGFQWWTKVAYTAAKYKGSMTVTLPCGDTNYNVFKFQYLPRGNNFLNPTGESHEIRVNNSLPCGSKPAPTPLPSVTPPTKPTPTYISPTPTNSPTQTPCDGQSQLNPRFPNTPCPTQKSSNDSYQNSDSYSYNQACFGSTTYGSLGSSRTTIIMPNETGFYSNAGTIIGSLNLIGDTNVKLTLEHQRLGGLWWDDIASDSTDGEIKYVSYNSVDGFYRWRIESSGGAVNFSLCSQAP